MTVQELIDNLSKIKDTTLPVVLVEWSVQNPRQTKYDLDGRILVQPHKVAIVID